MTLIAHPHERFMRDAEFHARVFRTWQQMCVDGLAVSPEIVIAVMHTADQLAEEPPPEQQRAIEIERSLIDRWLETSEPEDPPAERMMRDACLDPEDER